MSEYFKDTLANGLRLVTVEMPHLHSAEMVCYVGVGSRNETAELAGISHFLEHMLFRGTADFPSSLHLERAFEGIGGLVNASTDAETSCFHSRLHPAHIGEGAALFVSMLTRPLLNELEVERRIILEEALEDLNESGEEVNPDNLTSRLLWPGHPLSLPTIGTRESIARITAQDLRRHLDCHYSPSNTVITVAGRVRQEAALAAVEEAFGAWRGGSSPEPEPLSFRPAAEQAIWVRNADSQVTLQLAFRTPGRDSALSVPLRVLRRILAGSGTSRLMLHLREALGLTYSVDANLTLFADSGCFTIDLSVAPENLLPAVKETLDVLEGVCREPVADEELAGVIRTYLFDLEFSRDQADSLALRYGWGELVGHLRTLERDRRELAAVTAEELQGAARGLFLAGELKAAFVGPWRKKDRAAVERLLPGFRKG